MLAYVLLFTFCSIAASQYTNVDTGISRFGFEFYKVIEFAWFQDYKKMACSECEKKLKKVFSRNRLFLFFVVEWINDLTATGMCKFNDRVAFLLNNKPKKKHDQRCSIYKIN